MARILIIDDDPLQQALASRTLADAGHEVHGAPDGEAGLAKVRELKPDLVVCDVVMPKMNGYQVVAAVRADTSIAATPIMLLTSMAERAQVRLGMTSGADDYLPKPYRPQELIEAARALLQRSRTHEAAAMHVLHDRFADALRAQQDALSFKYEHQLANELSARWDRETGREMHGEFIGATLVMVNLFTAMHVQGGGAESATRAFQAVRDTLYLFGAVCVAPYGECVLAIFEQKDEAPLPAIAQGVRAALAVKAAATHSLEEETARQLCVAVVRGDVQMLSLDDPLHGDGGNAILPGPAVRDAAALVMHTQACGWHVGALREDVADLPLDVALSARTSALGGRAACELTLPPQG